MVLLSFLMLMGVFIGLVSGDTSVIQPSSKDSWIRSILPNDSGGGTTTFLWVHQFSGDDEARVFVQWSLASIPTGSTIISSIASLNVQSNNYNGDRIATMRRVTASWTEEMTWNNQPSTTSSNSAITTLTEDFGWFSWNITAITQTWIDGTANNGVRISVSIEGSSFGFVSREHGTSSWRPNLTIEYTSPEIPSPAFQVRLSGGLDNITSEVGATNTEFNAIVENTGNVILGLVNLQLLNDTAIVILEVNLLNIGIGESRSYQFIYTHGLSEGTYAWQLNGTYEDLDSEYWNFTLYVGPTGTLITAYVSITSLQPAQITVDGFSTLSISISNVGTEAIVFRVSATSVDLILSPTTSQIVIIGGNRGTTIDFIVVPLEDGKFWLSTLVTPINITSGVGVGRSDSSEHLLIVTKAAVITTFNAQDIGINDVILHGKISSLGGFATAKVYFVLWETGSGIDTAVVLPPNKQVIAYVSDFRVWYGNLVPDTDYSYEVRMELGPSSNPFVYYGGIIEFSTTETFTDPFIAMRNGFAGFLGIDSIVMGIILSVIFIVLFTVLFSMLISEHIEGMAATIVMATSIFGFSSIFFAIGWIPLWILIFLGVILVAIITGFPRLRGGSGE